MVEKWIRTIYSFPVYTKDTECTQENLWSWSVLGSHLLRPESRMSSGFIVLPKIFFAVVISASGWKLRLCWSFYVRFQFVCCPTVNFHGLPREKKPYIFVEVDLSRLGTLEPQVDEVAQCPLFCLQDVIRDCQFLISFHRNRKRSLPQECLVIGWHFLQVIFHHKHLHHSLVRIK